MSDLPSLAHRFLLRIATWVGVATLLPVPSAVRAAKPNRRKPGSGGPALQASDTHSERSRDSMCGLAPLHSCMPAGVPSVVL